MAAETVEEMPLGVVALDDQLRVTYANPVALTLVGTRLSELVGRRPWDLFPAIVGTHHQTARTSAAISVEYEEHFAPSDRWVAVLACPTKTGTSIFLRDIAGQKRAEVTVRTSVALLHGSLDAMLDACMLCSAERDDLGAIVGFRVEFANVVAGAFLGGPPEKLMGGPIPEWRANPSDKSFVDACRGVVESGEAWAIDALAYEISGPEGASTAGALSLQVARFSDGFFATWRDVTESQRTVRERDLLVAVVEQAIDGIIILDEAGAITYANPSFLVANGLDLERVIGHPAEAIALALAVTSQDAFAGFADAARAATPWREEIDQPSPEGTTRRLDISLTPVHDASANVTGYVVRVRDITDRRRADLEMRKLARAIEQTADSVVITDTSGRIEYVNPAFERVTGYARAEVMGQNPRILKSGVHGPTFYSAMWSALTRGLSFTADVTNRRKDGSLFQEESVVSPIVDDAGSITSYVAVKRDVTRERASEAARERNARERASIARGLADLPVGPTPEVTGDLICRQVVTLAEITSAALYYFTLEGPGMALAFVRSDGVPVSLRRLPARPSKNLRARAGAGPWVEARVRRPWHPYDRLMRDLGVGAIASAPVRHGGQLIGLLSVSSSGANAISHLTESLPALLEFAGFAGALLGRAVVDLAEIDLTRGRISQVITDVAFRPVFQPIVDVATGEHAGYEALTRFASGTAPDVVFAAARAAGLEAELELATVAAALSASTALPARAWLSLNVSPALLADARLSAVLALTTRPVVFEVTEHVAIPDYAELRSAIGRLGPGFRVAVDDAGAGIANFGHIVQLRPAFVKLDIGLIRGVDMDLTRQALIVGLLHFASESDSEAIAEGVETEEELATLKTLGVRLVQGYLVGRPAPVAEWVARAEAMSAHDDARAERRTVAGARDHARAERDTIAGTRPHATSERDTIARARDAAAAERDAIAEARDAIRR